jgi:predicted KAP-like P-loop ATPase
MWPDNETARDLLNFSGVADTVAEIIVQARGRPISIGVSGAWGIGKSSMIKLTQASFAKRQQQPGQREFIFVEFNAWLYQGYDDARAELMDVIASKLEDEAEKRETAIDKAKDLLRRVKWLRTLVHGSELRVQWAPPSSTLTRCGRTPGVRARACGSARRRRPPLRSLGVRRFAIAARRR